MDTNVGICAHCRIETDLIEGFCEDCQDPKTCEAGNNGDRCEGCARSLHELHQDLLSKE